MPAWMNIEKTPAITPLNFWEDITDALCKIVVKKINCDCIYGFQ